MKTHLKIHFESYLFASLATIFGYFAIRNAPGITADETYSSFVATTGLTLYFGIEAFRYRSHAKKARLSEPPEPMQSNETTEK